jgi:hypothetical protein
MMVYPLLVPIEIIVRAATANFTDLNALNMYYKDFVYDN